MELARAISPTLSAAVGRLSERATRENAPFIIYLYRILRLKLTFHSGDGGSGSSANEVLFLQQFQRGPAVQCSTQNEPMEESCSSIFLSSSYAKGILCKVRTTSFACISRRCERAIRKQF